MPNYTRFGKVESVLTLDEFVKGMDTGIFKSESHTGFLALLYYTGIRVSEGLRSHPEQFQITDHMIMYDVGKRLKHGMNTPSLLIPRDLPYTDEIVKCVKATRPGARIWPYCRVTGFNIVSRVFRYPHHLRLSRITSFFLQEYPVAKVRSFTGLTLRALEFYVARVDVQDMARGLGQIPPDGKGTRFLHKKGGGKEYKKGKGVAWPGYCLSRL